MIFVAGWLVGFTPRVSAPGDHRRTDLQSFQAGTSSFHRHDVLCQLESVRKLFSFPSEDPRYKAAKPRFFWGISVGSSGVLEQVLLIGTTPTISPFSLLWPGCWPGSWSLSIEIFLASNVKTGGCICLKLMSR